MQNNNLALKKNDYYVFAKDGNRILVVQGNRKEEDILREISEKVKSWQTKFPDYWEQRNLKDGYIIIAETNAKRALDMALKQIEESGGKKA